MGWLDRFRSDERPFRLVAFLGNPGAKHARSRHNVGWRVGRAVLAARPGANTRRRYQSEFALCQLGSYPSALLFPHTYMNESGRAVRAALRGLRLESQELVVVHDDLDLGFATLRIRCGGSAGGNRGVESIIDAIGDREFMRFKLGIGRPPPGQDPAKYVLGDFGRGQEPAAARMIAAATRALDQVGVLPPDQLMNEFNRDWGRSG